MTFTAIAFTVALTVTAIEIYFDFAIYRQITAVLSRTGAATAINGNILNQPATLIALYLWPVSLALWLRRYRSSSVLLIAIAVAIFLPSEAQSVSLALILGILAAIFATAFPHASKITLSLLIVVGMALMPVIPQVLQSVFEGREELIATSALHRLEIWNYVVSKIFSEPALGYGLEASRILGEGTRSAIAPSSTLLPLHPHNGFLQIWLELGLSGYLALGLLCLWLVHKVTQQKGAKMVFSTGLLVSGLSLFSTAFGMWQSWLIALEFASAGALLLTLKLEAKPSATGH